MKKSIFKLGLSLVLTTGMYAGIAMEKEWSKEIRQASAAASYVYDIAPVGEQSENDILSPKSHSPSLEGFKVIHSRLATQGSIQAVALYDAASSSAVVSFQGTKSAQDWRANLGIGCSIAQTVHTLDLMKDNRPVRLPDYFAGLATAKLQGLFGDESSMVDVRLLDLPLAGFLDTVVSFQPVKDRIWEACANTGKHVAVATAGCTAVGAGAGTFALPIVGTAAGALSGFAAGMFYGCAQGMYNASIVGYEGIRFATDKKYERAAHLEALLKLVDLKFIQSYVADSSTFLSESIRRILAECEGENRPQITITGHSLGRFLAGAAFLDYVGGNMTLENGIKIDGIDMIQNIGFNGPCGFQGLPHLPFMQGERAQQNIMSALDLLKENNLGAMHHVRRRNDLVGNLGHEFDFAEVIEISDVVRLAHVPVQEHFLNNHGMKLLTSLVHQ